MVREAVEEALGDLVPVFVLEPVVLAVVVFEVVKVTLAEAVEEADAEADTVEDWESDRLPELLAEAVVDPDSEGDWGGVSVAIGLCEAEMLGLNERLGDPVLVAAAVDVLLSFGDPEGVLE